MNNTKFAQWFGSRPSRAFVEVCGRLLVPFNVNTGHRSPTRCHSATDGKGSCNAITGYLYAAFCTCRQEADAHYYIYGLVTPTGPYHWALEEQVQLLQDVGHGLRGLVRVALLLW